MAIPIIKALIVLDEMFTIHAGQEHVLGSVDLQLIPYMHYKLSAGLPGVEIDGTARLELWLRVGGADQFRFVACGNDASQGAKQGYPLHAGCLLPVADDYVTRSFAVVAKAFGREIRIFNGEAPDGAYARGYIEIVEFGS
jgi:hypothetical protein